MATTSLAGRIATVMAAAAIATTSLVAAQDNVISSDTGGAMPPPRAWDCKRIFPEYEAWLDAGNTAETWRYVGKEYKDVADGTRYDWGDWLDWHARACPAAAPADAKLPGNAALIGGIVGALAITAIAAGGGGGGSSNSNRPDSPG